MFDKECLYYTYERLALAYIYENALSMHAIHTWRVLLLMCIWE